MSMKKLRPLFLAVILLTVCFSLWYNEYSGGRKYEGTEFLFDTECSITAYGKNAKKAVAAAFDRLAEINAATDMYREGSDVHRINSAAANTEIKVSAVTAEILSVAQQIAAETDGAFDVTIAPVTELWDFKSENPVPPAAADIKNALKRVGYAAMNVDHEKCTVTKSDGGVKIDLGGAAKGYAGDEALRVMRECGVNTAIADLGGNVTCMGKNPNSRDGKWRIGIQIPFAPTGEYGKIAETDGGAVVTSGTYQRNFKYKGKLYHHIIDTKTGYPANQNYSGVTISGKNACVADCLATACFVLGEEKGRTLAEKHGAEIFFVK